MGPTRFHWEQSSHLGYLGTRLEGVGGASDPHGRGRMACSRATGNGLIDGIAID